MKSLYIFVDSERPDQYLNPIVHCVLRNDVRKVGFIHIEGLTDGEPSLRSVTGLSARVMAAVHSQLEGLAERGEYLLTSGPRVGQRISLKDEYGRSRALSIQEYYRRCRDLSVTYSNEDLEYGNLRSMVRRIAAEGSGAFVDVTAIKKRYLGDLVAAGLVEGLKGLYTFDIEGSRIDFERPWRMLVHELETGSLPGFKYVNILDTALYRSCARLLLIGAPKMRVAAAITVTLLIAAGLGYWYIGVESRIVQTIVAISGFASILSLSFIFLTPRR